MYKAPKARHSLAPVVEWVKVKRVYDVVRPRKGWNKLEGSIKLENQGHLWVKLRAKKNHIHRVFSTRRVPNIRARCDARRLAGHSSRKIHRYNRSPRFKLAQVIANLMVRRLEAKRLCREEIYEETKSWQLRPRSLCTRLRMHGIVLCLWPSGYSMKTASELFVPPSSGE